jgi:major structural subunit of bundle-forming pilus
MTTVAFEVPTGHRGLLQLAPQVGVRKLSALAARRRQKGLTLIETAMVLGVAALVIAGVLVLYNTANTSNKTSDALNQLNIIQQAVRNVYGGTAGFTGLTTDTMVSSKSVPQKMITAAGGMANSFNGPVTVDAATVATTDDGFAVVFSGIPQEACVALGTKDYGRALASLITDSGSLMAVDQAALPTATDAALACARPSNNVMTWTFRN